MFLKANQLDRRKVFPRPWEKYLEMNNGVWRGDHFKYEALSLLLLLVLTGGAVIFLGMLIYTPEALFPSVAEKEKLAVRDLISISKCVRLYKEDFTEYPYSLEQLKFLNHGSGVSHSDCDSTKDPWGYNYQYFRISDERVALVSIGSNGKLDTTIEVLASTPSDELFNTGEKGVYRLAEHRDDSIYVVEH